MKRDFRRIKVIFAALIMSLAFCVTANAASADGHGEIAADYSGKTVILSTNDVHGAIEGYQYAAGLRKELEKRGAEVLLVDAGDFLQGSIYMVESKGEYAVRLMNMAGYDYTTPGNHEFNYGLDVLDSRLAQLNSKTLCADILYKDTGERKFQANDLYEDDDSDLKIGFFGMATPETQIKIRPSYFAGLTFPDKSRFYECAREQIKELRNKGADVVICLGHLGIDKDAAPYRSTDLLAETEGIDMFIDGHSHSVVTDDRVMQTGERFHNIGITVIDEKTEKIEDHYLYRLRDPKTDLFEALAPSDAEVKKAAEEMISDVNQKYDQKIAESLVDLNGARSVKESGVQGNRDSETNLGDLLTDGLVWYIRKEGIDLGVPPENVVSVLNGGSLRAGISKGDVTKKDMLDVDPFGDTVAAVHVKGAELLEALEVSTYCTPEPVSGFPQISGLEVELDVSRDYDACAEPYPESTYYGPKSINRITIKSVNGKEFDPDEEYVVLSNNFVADGGDTYRTFADAGSSFDTGIMLDYAVTEYIVGHLGGVIGEEYAKPQGRLTITGREIAAARKEAEAAKAEAAAAKAEAEAANARAAEAERIAAEALKTVEELKKAAGKADMRAKYTPAKVVLKKAKGGKRKITLSFGRVASNAAGYEIRLEKTGMGDVKSVIVKQGKKSSLKKTVKKLKKGRYKVKVRAYNTKGGIDYYGPWSKTKSVKVK